MIARALWYVVLFSALSFLVGVVGILITYFIQGSGSALNLLNSYMFCFNGVLVGGFGYGLLFFIRITEKQGFNSLLNVLQIPPEHEVDLLRYQNWVISEKRKHCVAAIVTVLGGTILWKLGYPHHGFAKFFLAATSISMFYVAGLMSGYFFSSILILSKLDEISDDIRIKDEANALELENLNLSFLVSSTIAMAALYVAFRGTLTADFLYPNGTEVFRKLLIYPMIIFLPGILFTSFYYRFVLRRIEGNQIIRKLEEVEEISRDMRCKVIDGRERLEMEKLIIELKQILFAERSKTPLLSLKDSPALFVLILFFVQFVVQNDGVINDFIKSIAK